MTAAPQGYLESGRWFDEGRQWLVYAGPDGVEVQTTPRYAVWSDASATALADALQAAVAYRANAAVGGAR